MNKPEPDMKPRFVENCKHLNTCDNGIHRDCVGCGVWNMLYNIDALFEWCREQDKGIMDMMTELHKYLNE